MTDEEMAVVMKHDYHPLARIIESIERLIAILEKPDDARTEE